MVEDTGMRYIKEINKVKAHQGKDDNGKKLWRAIANDWASHYASLGR